MSTPSSPGVEVPEPTARDLTRLELVTEAVRAALEELTRTAGHPPPDILT